MKPTSSSPGRRRSIAPVVAPLAVVVLGFVAAAIYGEARATAIDHETDLLESNAIPSVEYLAAAREELWHLELRGRRLRGRPWRTASRRRYRHADRPAGSGSRSDRGVRDRSVSWGDGASGGGDAGARGDRPAHRTSARDGCRRARAGARRHATRGTSDLPADRCDHPAYSVPERGRGPRRGSQDRRCSRGHGAVELLAQLGVHHARGGGGRGNCPRA